MEKEWAAAVKAKICMPAPLVRYKFPYVVADAHPKVYRHCRGLFSRRAPELAAAATNAAAAPGGAAAEAHAAPRRLVVGLHVRRGELFIRDSDRMLPNRYYVGLAERVAKQCTQLQVPYTFELYSEVAHKPT